MATVGAVGEELVQRARALLAETAPASDVWRKTMNDLCSQVSTQSAANAELESKLATSEAQRTATMQQLASRVQQVKTVLADKDKLIAELRARAESAEAGSKQTQETLAARERDLLQVKGRLAEMETRVRPDDDDASASSASSTPATKPAGGGFFSSIVGVFSPEPEGGKSSRERDPEELRKELKDKRREVTRLERMLAVVSEDRETLTKELGSANQSKIDAEVRVKAAEDALAAVRLDLARVSSDLQEAQKRSAALAAAPPAAAPVAAPAPRADSAEIAVLRSTLATTEWQLNEAQMKIEELTRSIETQKSEMSTLRTEWFAAESEKGSIKDSLTASLTAMTGERDALATKLQTARGQMAEVRNLLQKLEERLAAAEGERDTLRGELANTKEQLQAALTEASRLAEAAKVDAQALIAERERSQGAQAAQLNELHSTVKEAAERAQRDVASMRQAKEATETELATALSRAQALDASLAEALASATSSKQEVTRLEGALAQAAAQHGASASDVSALQANLKALHEEQDQRTKELASARAELHTATERVQHLEGEVARYAKLNEELRGTEDRLRQEGVRTNEELAAQHEKIAQMMADLERAAAATQAATAARGEAEKQTAEATAALAAAKTELAGSRTASASELGKITAEKAALNEQLKEAQGSTNTQTARVAELTAQLATVNGELSEVKAAAAQASRDLEAAREAHELDRKQLHDLRGTAAQREKDSLAELAKLREALEQATATHSSTATEAQKTAEQQRARVAELEQKLAKSEEAAAGEKTARETAEEASTKRIADLEAALSKSKQEHAEGTSASGKRVAELEAALETAKQHAASEKKTLEDLRSHTTEQAAASATQIASLQEKLAALSSELAAAQTARDQERTAADSKATALQADLKAATEAAAKQKQELRTAAERISALEAQVTAARAEMSGNATNIAQAHEAAIAALNESHGKALAKAQSDHQAVATELGAAKDAAVALNAQLAASKANEEKTTAELSASAAAAVAAKEDLLVAIDSHRAVTEASETSHREAMTQAGYRATELETRVAGLEATLTRLRTGHQADGDALRDQLTKAESRAAAAEAEVTTQRTAHAAVVEAATTRNAEHAKVVEAAHAQHTEAERRLAEVTRERDEAMNGRESVAKERDALTAVVAKRDEELAALKTASSETQSRSKEELGKVEAQLKAESAKLASATAATQEAQAKHADAVRETKVLQDRINDLESAATAHDEGRSALVSRMGAEKAEAERERNTLQATVEKLEAAHAADVKTHEEKLLAATKATEAAEHARGETEKQLTGMREQLQEASQQLAAARSELEGANKKIEAQHSEHTAAAAASVAAAAAMEATLQKTREELAAARADHATAATGHSEKESEVEALRGQVAKLTDEHGTLARQLTTLVAQLQRQDEELGQRRAECADAVARLQDAQATNTGLTQKVASLTEDLDGAREEVSVRRSELAAEGVQLAAERERHVAVAQEKAAVQQELTAVKQELATVKQELASLKVALEAETAEKQRAVSDLANARQATADGAARELEEVKSRLGASTAEADGLKARLADAEAATTSARAEATASQQKATEAEGHATELGGRLHKANEHIQTLQRHHAVAASDAAAVTQELTASRAETTALQVARSEVEAEVREVRQELKTARADAEAKLKSVTAELEAIKEKLTAAEAEAQAAKSKLAEAPVATTPGVEAAVAVGAVAAVAAVAVDEQRLAKLEADLQGATMERERLQSELAAANNERASTTERASKVEASLVEATQRAETAEARIKQIQQERENEKQTAGEHAEAAAGLAAATVAKAALEARITALEGEQQTAAASTAAATTRATSAEAERDAAVTRATQAEAARDAATARAVTAEGERDAARASAASAAAAVTAAPAATPSDAEHERVENLRREVAELQQHLADSIAAHAAGAVSPAPADRIQELEARVLAVETERDAIAIDLAAARRLLSRSLADAGVARTERDEARAALAVAESAAASIKTQDEEPPVQLDARPAKNTSSNLRLDLSKLDIARPEPVVEAQPVVEPQSAPGPAGGDSAGAPPAEPPREAIHQDVAEVKAILARLEQTHAETATRQPTHSQEKLDTALASALAPLRERLMAMEKQQDTTARERESRLEAQLLEMKQTLDALHQARATPTESSDALPPRPESTSLPEGETSPITPTIPDDRPASPAPSASSSRLNAFKRIGRILTFTSKRNRPATTNTPLSTARSTADLTSAETDGNESEAGPSNPGLRPSMSNADIVNQSPERVAAVLRERERMVGELRTARQIMQRSMQAAAVSKAIAANAQADVEAAAGLRVEVETLQAQLRTATSKLRLLSGDAGGAGQHIDDLDDKLKQSLILRDLLNTQLVDIEAQLNAERRNSAALTQQIAALKEQLEDSPAAVKPAVVSSTPTRTSPDGKGKGPADPDEVALVAEPRANAPAAPTVTAAAEDTLNATLDDVSPINSDDDQPNATGTEQAPANGDGPRRVRRRRKPKRPASDAVAAPIVEADSLDEVSAPSDPDQEKGGLGSAERLALLERMQGFATELAAERAHVAALTPQLEALRAVEDTFVDKLQTAEGELVEANDRAAAAEKKMKDFEVEVVALRASTAKATAGAEDADARLAAATAKSAGDVIALAAAETASQKATRKLQNLEKQVAALQKELTESRAGEAKQANAVRMLGEALEVERGHVRELTEAEDRQVAKMQEIASMLDDGLMKVSDLEASLEDREKELARVGSKWTSTRAQRDQFAEELAATKRRLERRSARWQERKEAVANAVMAEHERVARTLKAAEEQNSLVQKLTAERNELAARLLAAQQEIEKIQTLVNGSEKLMQNYKETLTARRELKATVTRLEQGVQVRDERIRDLEARAEAAEAAAASRQHEAEEASRAKRQLTQECDELRTGKATAEAEASHNHTLFYAAKKDAKQQVMAAEANVQKKVDAAESQIKALTSRLHAAEELNRDTDLAMSRMQKELDEATERLGDFDATTDIRQELEDMTMKLRDAVQARDRAEVELSHEVERRQSEAQEHSRTLAAAESRSAVFARSAKLASLKPVPITSTPDHAATRPRSPGASPVDERDTPGVPNDEPEAEERAMEDAASVSERSVEDVGVAARSHEMALLMDHTEHMLKTPHQGGKCTCNDWGFVRAKLAKLGWTDSHLRLAVSLTMRADTAAKEARGWREKHDRLRRESEQNTQAKAQAERSAKDLSSELDLLRRTFKLSQMKPHRSSPTTVAPASKKRRSNVGTLV